jgi:hypothetical protein
VGKVVASGAHAPPLVMFTTTSNTTIAPSTVKEANQLGVAVWQQMVEYDANSATPNNPNLRIAKPECLNDSVYTTSPSTVKFTWIDPLKSWPENPLTWATDAEQDAVGAVPDPDSPAVVP